MIDLIYESTVKALGVCPNCLCTDCGCCVGCGGIDADLDPKCHGYVCVM